MRPRHLALAVPVLFLFWFAPTLEAVGEGRVIGTVSADPGGPLEGVKVLITSQDVATRQEKVTDTQGTFSALILDATRRYRVRLEKVGYTTYEGPLEVKLSDTIRLSFSLSKGAVPARTATPPAEEAAVLALLDRYMHAISAQDVKGMAAMQTPDGMTYRARAAEGGGWAVTSRSNASWVDSSSVDARTLRERYWSPTVLIRGGIAVVWAPYEFWIDGKTSHCGIDVYDFVKIDGAWRVSNAMWTVEPNACAELRPKDPSTIRPPG